MEKNNKNLKTFNRSFVNVRILVSRFQTKVNFADYSWIIETNKVTSIITRVSINWIGCFLQRRHRTNCCIVVIVVKHAIGKKMLLLLLL